MKQVIPTLAHTFILNEFIRDLIHEIKRYQAQEQLCLLSLIGQSLDLHEYQNYQAVAIKHVHNLILLLQCLRLYSNCYLDYIIFQQNLLF